MEMNSISYNKTNNDPEAKICVMCNSDLENHNIHWTLKFEAERVNDDETEVLKSNNLGNVCQACTEKYHLKLKIHGVEQLNLAI